MRPSLELGGVDRGQPVHLPGDPPPDPASHQSSFRVRVEHRAGRGLEAAAAHFSIDSGPLVARIEELIAFGLITQQFGEVLDHVRQLGNLGAHAADETVDEASAERAFRFTTQVLRNLFEIPAELEGSAATTQEDDATPAMPKKPPPSFE